MKQFDVYENPIVRARSAMPYLVVLSSHLLPDLTEVIVAPLTRQRSRAIAPIELSIVYGDETLVLVPFDMAAIATRRLSRHHGRLDDHEYDIRRALDRLFTSF